MSTLIKNIKRLLREQGLDQADLAEELGVRPGTVSSWMQGKTEMSVSYFAQMCRYLSVAPNELLGMNAESFGDGAAEVSRQRQYELDIVRKYELAKQHLSDPKFDEFGQLMQVLDLGLISEQGKAEWRLYTWKLIQHSIENFSREKSKDTGSTHRGTRSKLKA